MQLQGVRKFRFTRQGQQKYWLGLYKGLPVRIDDHHPRLLKQLDEPSFEQAFRNYVLIAALRPSAPLA
jgi:hypothetical protein